MAKTVTQAFTDFKSNLEITSLQSSTVSTRQSNVRANVAKEMTVLGDFLAGSYQRSTMIAPLKDADIDVIIVLSSTYKGTETNAQANLLDKVKRAISRYYTEATGISRDGQAVTIQFSDFQVDVVPAFDRGILLGGYTIPDSIGKRWIDTDPKKHVTQWSESNKNRGGKLVPLIKMLKAWNRAHSRLLRSFHLEAMVRQVFEYREIDSYPAAAAHFFGNCDAYVSWLSDPAGYGGNLANYVLNSSTLGAEIKSRLKSAKTKADEAIKLNAEGKNEAAIGKWGIVFGDYFPTYG